MTRAVAAVRHGLAESNLTFGIKSVKLTPQLMYVLSSAASHLVCNIRSDHSPRPAAKDFATCRSPMPREDCLLSTAMRIRPQAAGMLTNTGASRMMMTMNRLAALAGCISYKLSGDMWLRT